MHLLVLGKESGLRDTRSLLVFGGELDFGNEFPSDTVRRLSLVFRLGHHLHDMPMLPMVFDAAHNELAMELLRGIDGTEDELRTMLDSSGCGQPTVLGQGDQVFGRHD